MKKREKLKDKVISIYREAKKDLTTVRNINDLALFTSVSSSMKDTGPITITTGMYGDDPITLMTLGGTEFVDGQATTFKESKLASYGMSNDYILNVLDLFHSGAVPSDREIILTGISLGGMIAQQVMADEYVREHYKFKAIVCFGSPLVPPLNNRLDKVWRLCDSHDIVPKSGAIALRKQRKKYGGKKAINTLISSLDARERHIRTSIYKNPLKAHMLSYVSTNVWNDVDFDGVDGDSSAIIKLDTPLVFYPNPIRGIDKN